MYRPYEPNPVRQDIPPSLRGDLTALYIEQAYSDDAQTVRVDRENNSGIDLGKLRLYRVGAQALTGVERDLLRKAQYPEV
jgi:hypothetical protein